MVRYVAQRGEKLKRRRRISGRRGRCYRNTRPNRAAHILMPMPATAIEAMSAKASRKTYPQLGQCSTSASKKQ